VINFFVMVIFFFSGLFQNYLNGADIFDECDNIMDLEDLTNKEILVPDYSYILALELFAGISNLNAGQGKVEAEQKNNTQELVEEKNEKEESESESEDVQIEAQDKFICDRPVCNLVCNNYRALKAHLRKVHKVAAKQCFVYKCSYVDKYNNMARHIQWFHKKCSKCFKQFLSKKEAKDCCN